MRPMTCETRCVLTISGPIAQSVTEAIRSRFDGIATRIGENTSVTVEDVDQAAVRAVMIMLWDSGHDVVTMVITPSAATDAPGC